MITLKRVDGSIIIDKAFNTVKEGAEYCAKNKISMQDADLRGAKNIGAFNKLNGRTCFWVIHENGLMIQAGCFWGTLQEFETAAKKQYPNNPVEAYEAQIQYLKTLGNQTK